MNSVFPIAMFDNQRVYYGIFPCPWTDPDTQLAAMLLYAMLPYLLLCLHNDGMLRDDIFSWVSSGLNNLAHTNSMLHSDIFFCACTILHANTRCCVVISFLRPILPMDFCNRNWPSGHWPTTWSSKTWGVFVHWRQQRNGARSRVNGCLYVLQMLYS